MRRLARAEWQAIETALNQTLAGPLDGFIEGSYEEATMQKFMVSALAKVQERLS